MILLNEDDAKGILSSLCVSIYLQKLSFHKFDYKNCANVSLSIIETGQKSFI